MIWDEQLGKGPRLQALYCKGNSFMWHWWNLLIMEELSLKPILSTSVTKQDPMGLSLDRSLLHILC